MAAVLAFIYLIETLTIPLIESNGENEPPEYFVPNSKKPLEGNIQEAFRLRSQSNHAGRAAGTVALVKALAAWSNGASWLCSFAMIGSLYLFMSAVHSERFSSIWES